MTFTQFSQLVLTKVQLNLKSEARKSYLSYLWWILEPALFVGVFYLVFGVFLSRGTENFLVFLLCGQIPFLWFARTVSNSVSAIENGRSLMQQIKITKVFFPVVNIIQDLIKSMFVFALLLVFLLIYGVEYQSSWLYLPLLLVVQFMFVSGFALFASMVVPFFPDFKFLVNTGLQLLMFGSGIFYDYKTVILEQHQELFLLNPMAKLLSEYRGILLEGVTPNFASLGYVAVIGVTMVLFSVAMIRQLDSHYPRILAQ